MEGLWLPGFFIAFFAIFGALLLMMQREAARRLELLAPCPDEVEL